MAVNHAVPVAASFVTANLAAAVVSVQTHDGGRFVTIVGAMTVAITSLFGMVSFLAPKLAQVIREAVPPIVEALDTVRKQREELARGSYTEQIAELKEMLAEMPKLQAHLEDLKSDNAQLRNHLDEMERVHAERADQAARRVEDANKKLHDIRNKMGADILNKDAKIAELEQEVHGLRREVERLVAQHAARADEHDQKLAVNAANIATSVGSIATILRGRTPDPDLDPESDGAGPGVHLGIDVTGASPGKGDRS